MSKARLTRQELGWLLTQEAAGAAERLRMGVQVLNASGAAAAAEPASLDATLNALDDAMKMLSSLHSRPSAVRGRRGRIDLAALIWEVAPEARVSIEPGSGTEVFGDEAEIRRMLHVLAGQGTGGGAAITIRREEDEVRVAVVLGPDSSVTADTERAWMSRMAVRYGGRYELEGGAEVLSLPADGVSERNEREALRKELDEARKQGEAYARELAQVYTQEAVAGGVPSTVPPPHPSEPAAERLAALSRFSAGVAAELRSILSPAARQLPVRPARSSQPQLGQVVGQSSSSIALAENPEERWEVVRRALVRAQDFVGGLAHLGELDSEEPHTDVDLVETARSVVSALSGRADRSGVLLHVSTRLEGIAAPVSHERGRVLATDPQAGLVDAKDSERAPVSERSRGEELPVRSAPRALSVLLRELVGQAIASSPRGASVTITITNAEADGPRICVEDAGAPLPASARRSFVGLDIEPGTHGRATSVPLYVANEIAGWLGVSLELADAEAGGLRIIVTFPRGTLAR
ncbi:ATP-binding protein [Pendulispora brunnea]|uniref:histidine kinase n=1 Tax=Pendulispora brunnea TaxID=2905690 RepID=A0ABZ2KI56_9BACT